MAYCYKPVDRGQRFLLPPDMAEWLPAGHLVWFVLEVVGRVDTSALHARHGNDGPGRRAYDPDMLLALLLYAYCTEVRSSRRIERLCVVDVAYRVITGNSGPDHTTIARFRQVYRVLAQSLFVEVLGLCSAAGLAKVGVVAVDGTKMGADASLRANRTREQIAAQVAAMFDQAERVDSDEDRLFGEANGDELPAELIDPRSRKSRLDAASAVLDAQRRARQDETAAAAAARLAAEADAVDSGGRRRRGRPWSGTEVAAAEAALVNARQKAQANQDAVEAKAAARGDRRGRPRAHPEGFSVTKAEARLARAQQRAETPSQEPAKPRVEPRANTTDPDSRIMSTTKGWIQGYNAQAAANQHGIVLAATVTQDHNDMRWCVPMMHAIRTNLDAAGIADPIGTLLFDAGYCSEANLTAPGPDRIIATTKSWKLRDEARQNGFTHGDAPPDATPIDAMEHRLRTQEGTALYSQRQHTIEPVFGHTKANRGYRRFTRRGLPAVNDEWQLIATTNNLQRLHNHPPAPKAP